MYVSDALGSVRAVYNASASAFSVGTYKPFGKPYTDPPSGTGNIRYAQEMQDPTTGLYYVYARYMDPELGRFIGMDPELGGLSAPQSQNRYVYCIDNPLILRDPLGTVVEGEWWWLEGGGTAALPIYLGLGAAMYIQHWIDTGEKWDCWQFERYVLLYSSTGVIDPTPGVPDVPSDYLDDTAGFGDILITGEDSPWYLKNPYGTGNWGPTWPEVQNGLQDIKDTFALPESGVEDYLSFVWGITPAVSLENARSQVWIYYHYAPQSDYEAYRLWHSNVNDWTYCFDLSPIDRGTLIVTHILPGRAIIV